MDQSVALSVLKSGCNVFLTGQAGSGKTYVLNKYISWLRACDIPVAITASTGIAATHIGGVTIHSWSGIGIKEYLSDEDVDIIASKQWIRNNISNCKVLIIDEISMLSSNFLENIERIVQAVTYDDSPWWWLQVIFCGDFFQLPPISRSFSQHKKFAFYAKAWNKSDLHFCYLTTQYRQSENAFGELLNALRTGQMTESMIALLESRMHAKLTTPSPVRLYTHNADVDLINEEQLEKLPGKIYLFEAEKKWDNKLSNALLKWLLTPESLELKEGAAVLFVKNNPQKWYFNGTTGVVSSFNSAGLPRVTISNGREIMVEKETWSIEDEEDIIASVSQIPLKLAWAITVHKSQGMTLDAAIIDLSKSFEIGQSYVALSRIKSLEWLSLLWLDKNQLWSHDLIMRGDAYFRKQSDELATSMLDENKDSIRQRHKAFAQRAGWEYVTEQEAQEYETKKKDYKQKKKKKSTADVTADLITEGLKLDEIVAKRWLTKTTIINHIKKISIESPNINLSWVKPPKSILLRVQAAIKVLSQNKDNFNEYWLIHMKNIYTELDRSVPYEDIKRCMVFINST